jgi:TonB family protein
MAKGKKTCKILKEIRRQIAEANDIEYVVEECQYKGDCLGTCPKCEAEVRYLEQQLHQRQLLGKAVVLAGVSVGMFTLSSCNFNNKTQGESPMAATEEVTTGSVLMPAKKDTSNDTIVQVKSDIVKSVRQPLMGTAPVIKKDIEDECLPQDCELKNIESEDENVESHKVVFDEKERYKQDENGVYDSVEEMPSYSGGTAALMVFIQKNFKYPKEVEELGIQGRIVCTMVINEDGSISDIKVVKSVHPLYDAEFVRVIEAMPKWNPGKHSGKPVKVKYTIPMTMCFRN